MSGYLVRRLLQAFALLAVMSALVFTAVYVIGNPVDVLIDPQASQADAARAAAALGLDRPLPVQYWRFLVHAVQGDLGRSFVANVPAMGLVLHRLPATLELAVAATAIAVFLGVPLGLWAGMRPGSRAARLIMTGSVLGFSLPTFWVGVMLVSVFSVWLGWLPPAGRGATVEVLGVPVSLLTLDGWRHALLPAVNLALFQLALMIRLVRAGAAEAYASDYVRFARAKGVPERKVASRHVLPNIAIPVVTVTGLEFGTVIAFAIVTETIFAWPGMGKLLIDSINMLDRPVIVAYLLVVVCIFVAINLALDLAYTALDPRVRLPGTRA
jgi:peptide/nickel transport system permease protein